MARLEPNIRQRGIEIRLERDSVRQESYRPKAGDLMSKEFVERRDGSFYLAGSRVPLAHIVREFQRGESRPCIRRPTRRKNCRTQFGGAL